MLLHHVKAFSHSVGILLSKCWFLCKLSLKSTAEAQLGLLNNNVFKGGNIFSVNHFTARVSFHELKTTCNNSYWPTAVEGNNVLSVVTNHYWQIGSYQIYTSQTNPSSLLVSHCYNTNIVLRFGRLLLIHYVYLVFYNITWTSLHLSKAFVYFMQTPTHKNGDGFHMWVAFTMKLNSQWAWSSPGY